MKIISLYTATVVLAAALPGIVAGFPSVAVAQPESLTKEALVTVTFGAVIMQVPMRMASQLCPDSDFSEIPGANSDDVGIACVIPHEEYTSHDASALNDHE